MCVFSLIRPKTTWKSGYLTRVFELRPVPLCHEDSAQRRCNSSLKLTCSRRLASCGIRVTSLSVGNLWASVLIRSLLQSFWMLESGGSLSLVTCRNPDFFSDHPEPLFCHRFDRSIPPASADRRHERTRVLEEPARRPIQSGPVGSRYHRAAANARAVRRA